MVLFTSSFLRGRLALLRLSLRDRLPSYQVSLLPLLSSAIMNSFMQNNLMNLLPCAYVQQQNTFINPGAPTPDLFNHPTAGAPTPDLFTLPHHIQQQLDLQRLAAAQIHLLRQQQLLQQLNVFSNSSHFHPNNSSQFGDSRQPLTLIESKVRTSINTKGYHTVAGLHRSDHTVAGLHRSDHTVAGLHRTVHTKGKCVLQRKQSISGHQLQQRTDTEQTEDTVNKKDTTKTEGQQPQSRSLTEGHDQRPQSRSLTEGHDQRHQTHCVTEVYNQRPQSLPAQTEGYSQNQQTFLGPTEGQDQRPKSEPPLTSDICTEIKQEILKQLKLEQEESERTSENQKENQYTEDVMAHRNNRRSRQSAYNVPYQSIQRPRSSSFAGNSPDGVTGVLHPSQLSAIDNHMMAHYNQNKQPEDMYARKMQLRDALYAVMKGVFPYCGLYVVGSSMSGFGSSHSDMDLCLMLSHCEIDQRSEATEILRVLFKSLKTCDFLREIKIIKAKVPILRFVDKLSNVECDLNINNGTGIRNTHLLNAYSRCDWRLNPLVLFIKFWAKFHNINDAKNCTLSSYSLVLMIVHFLQAGVSPAVLPCLQQIYPQKFSPTLDIRTISLSESLPDFKSQNNQSVGELFVGFLNYYANVFNFETDAISVRLGCVLRREVVQRQNPIVNPPSQWKCICIEEPFNLSNTSRSVYDHYIFTRILRVFRTSWSRICKTGHLSSIIDYPI